MRQMSLTHFGFGVMLGTFFMMGLVDPEARAAPVTLNFQSTVNVVEGPLNGGPIALGDTITGSFTYESTTPKFEEVFPGFRYHALTAFDITVGSYSASFSGPATKEIIIFPRVDGSGSIGALIRDDDGLIGPDINGLSLQSAGVALNTDNAFSLPQLLPPNPLPSTLNNNDFDTISAGLSFFGPNASGVNSDFSIGADPSVQPVPVPSAMLLMGTGLAGLFGWRWWNTKTA